MTDVRFKREGEMTGVGVGVGRDLLYHLQEWKSVNHPKFKVNSSLVTSGTMIQS